jgi:hypothetical protein
MTLDNAREARLAKENYGQQYGQSLETDVGSADGTATVAKDVVRWKGESPDAAPWRIYLGPWQPNTNANSSVVPTPGNEYASPTPWNTPPTQFDALSEGQLYAKIEFGSGGVKHTAFVDWPRRGCLVQVSACYVQVNGEGTIGTLGERTLLPTIAATLAPEPGGGDAVQSATYTYPRQEALGDDGARIVFQVPPFARAFTPLVDRRSGLPPILTVVASNGLGGAISSWQWSTALGADFPDDRAVPLPGQDVADLFFQVDPGDAPLFAGCMFHLDL